MDNKAGGITREILQRALGQAKTARLQILEKMEACISSPDSLSPNAPRIYKTSIDPEKIRDVIGPGGKMIRSITQKTGVKINVEDSGDVSISGPTQEQVNEALSIVRGLTKNLAAGEIYRGTVTRLMTFGAFVECLPGKEGLLHLSEISTRRVPKVEDVFKPGDKVLVMVKEIDDMGRVNLTRRRIVGDEARATEAGFASCLPDERERDNLIESIAENAPPAGPRDRGDRERHDRGGDRGGRSDHRSSYSGRPRRD
jgi:polyribonucleotide nucleotidyltransferase